MNGTYEPHPEGGFIVQTPAGVPLRTAFDEERLRGMGYAPRPGLTAPGSQALASNDFIPAPAQGSTPTEQRAFAAWAPEPTKPPAPPEARTDAASAQASRDLFDRANAKLAGTGAAQARVEKNPDAQRSTLRGGGEVKEIDTGRGIGVGDQAPERPRYVVTPGRDQRVAFSVDKSPVDPKAWQQYERGEADLLERKKGIASDLQAREGVRSEVESAELQYQNQIEAADIIARERQQKAMAADYQRRAAAIDAERNAIANLDTKPDKLFNGNDWGKALAAFSVLAGGVLQGMRGGKNPALEALNDIADRSAAEKRQEYEKRRDALAGKESDFGRLVQLYGTPAAAEAELRDRKRLLMQKWAQKRAMDAGRADAADQLGMQFAQWDQERAAGVLERQQQMSDHVRETHQWQAPRVTQIGGQRPLKPDERERKVELGDGTYGFARTTAQAKEVQDKLTPGRIILSGLKDLEELRKQAGAVNVTPTQFDAIKMRMRTIAQGLAPMMNVRVGQGAMSKDEAAIKLQQMGDPEAIISGQSDKAIEETRRMEERVQRATAADYLYADPAASQSLGRPEAGGLRRER